MGEGADSWCVEEEYESVGEAPFICAAAGGSRGVLEGPESSIDEIDMLLPGRAVDDRAGNSRRPEKGGGGGGTCDMVTRALC